MGLFSVLTQAVRGGTVDADPSTTSSSGSSGTLPTVLQLFMGDGGPEDKEHGSSNNNPTEAGPHEEYDVSSSRRMIQLVDNDVSLVTGYSALTYQAIQVENVGGGSGGGGDDDDEEDLKNKHLTPDVGVWNCRASSSDHPQLVDALLETLIRHQTISVYCLTVDLTVPNQVEPTVTLLQHALVRHLIEHPPPSSSSSIDNTSTQRQTATTSLYDLQTTEFGKANKDDTKSTTTKKDEGDEGRPTTTTTTTNPSFRDVKITLMICAKLSAPPPLEEQPADGETLDYKTKQAQALVIYHLRKFAAALNCTLCFVEPPPPPSSRRNGTGTSSKKKMETTHGAGHSLHPTVDYNTVGKYWRDLALDIKIWEDTTGRGAVTSSSSLEERPHHDGDDTTTTPQGDDVANETGPPTPETVEVASPLYGPGKHYEDLIESVVLRSAHYPGHWDASTDSLWIALPTASTTTNSHGTSSGGRTNVGGDAGWLGQLRESIASATDAAAAAAAAAASPETTSTDDDNNKKKEGKDADVSDFFASLLKNP
jgi:hypothetical protein